MADIAITLRVGLEARGWQVQALETAPLSTCSTYLRLRAAGQPPSSKSSAAATPAAASSEDLHANLTGAEWTDDEAFAAYGLDYSASLPFAYGPWNGHSTVMATFMTVYVAARPGLNRNGTGSGQALGPNKKGHLNSTFTGQELLAADESGSTPDSVARAPRGGRGDGHPSRTDVAVGLVRSTRGLGRAALGRPRRVVSRRPLLTLLQVGFT